MTLTTHYIYYIHEHTLALSWSCCASWNLSLSLHLYLFIIEGYNVIVIIEFFPHDLVLEDFFSLEPMDDDFGDVDTFLNLWYN